MRNFWMLCLALAASWSGPAAAAEDKAPVTVFAAASLTEAMQAAGTAYTAQTGVPVRFSFASSATIARQIDAGAPADLFVSADREWMDYVGSRGLIVASSRATLVRGRLALIAPVGSTVTLRIGRGMPLARALGASG
ncbi:MAG: molybdate ABC transporter substrate-binding protein, partial [Sphingomonas sp.]